MCRGIETAFTMSQPRIRRALNLAAAGCIFAAGFIVTCLPIRSTRDHSLATLAMHLGGEGESPGVFYDRDFDFPTGYNYFEIPIWLLDLALIGSSVALLVALGLATPGC